MISILDSKNRLYQALLFMAIIGAVVIPVVKKGIIVYIPEESSFYYQLLANYTNNLSEFWQAVILAGIFVVVGAGFFVMGTGLGLIHSNQRAVPLFLTVVSLLAFPESIGFHPPLVSMLFLVPAVNNIIRAGSLNNPGKAIFNAGFLISVSSLIALPLVFFFPAFFMVLVVFRMYKRSYWGMLSAGIFLPWFYALLFGWVFRWWPVSDIYSLAGIWLSNVIYFFQYIVLAFVFVHILLFTSIIVLLISSFFSVYSRLDQMVFGERYIFRALLWLGIPGIPVILVAGGMVLQYMMVFGFFLTIVGSTYLVSLKRKKRINVLLWVIVLFMITGHLLQL